MDNMDAMDIHTGTYVIIVGYKFRYFMSLFNANILYINCITYVKHKLKKPLNLKKIIIRIFGIFRPKRKNQSQITHLIKYLN